MDSARAERMAAELTGKDVAGWRVERLLGNGKSALVFQASKNGTAAALKIFDPELVEKFGKDVQLERIGRELSLCGHSQSHLVKIYAGGACDHSGYLFVAMEIVAAPTLATALGDIPRSRIWPLLSQIAAAARFLESRDLAHRDIKPENIAVTTDFQTATLLDLGVMRPIGGSNITDHDQRVFIGTLQYSSPEFLLRQEQDTPEGWRAVTFYQLGAVLHDMIMRRPLFAEFENPYARLVQAIQHEIPRADAPDVPADLAQLAMNCLTKDPKLRLQLVRWDDFNPRPETRTSAAALKDRIRKRQVQRQDVVHRDENVDEEQRSLLTRRILGSVKGTLQRILREECIGSNLFPPIEIHDSPDVSPNNARFRVLFRPSPAHALSGTLSICFSVSLLDVLSQAVSLSMCACIAHAPPSCEQIPEPPASLAIRAVFQEAAFRSRIQLLLYSILDRSQCCTTVTDGCQTIGLDQDILAAIEEHHG